MTTHSVTYESVSSRGHTGPGLRPGSNWGFFQNSLGWRVVNLESLAIQDPLIPFSGYVIAPILRLMFRTITDDGPTISIGEAWAQQFAVSLDGSSLNNALIPVQPSTEFAPGRLAPDVVLLAGGAVTTALAALTGTTTQLDINAHCGYITETYQGMQHFCEFEDAPPDTQGDGHTRLNALVQALELSSARYQIGVDANGAAVFVEQAGFTAVDPAGVVYVRPEDIGPNALQIPAAMGDNTAASFRAHPSVFYPSGKSQYVRALTRQRRDDISIDTEAVDQPIQIVSVGSAPVTSNWLVTIDGAPMVIRVNHPVGSDLRRPRDIWEGVILPLINAGGANQAAVVYPTVQNNIGDAVLTRLQYADYWRCLPIAGTRIIQTGGG